MKKIFVTYIFVLLSTIAFSQPLTEIPVRYMLEAAEKAEIEMDIITALEWYEKAYDENKDPNLAMKVADMHRLQRDYQKAARWYGRIAGRDRNGVYPSALFYQGWMEQYNGENTNSVELLGQYLTKYPEGEHKDRALLILKSIKETWEVPDAPEIIIESVGKNVNTPLGEASPFLDADGNLYYTSFNEEEPVGYTEDDGVEKFFQMYKSAAIAQTEEKPTSRRKQSKDAGNWQKGELLNSNINREGYHVGSGCFSPDQKVMYFTRVEIQGNIQLSSKLYYSLYDKGDWGPATEVEGINGDHFVKYPFMGELFGEKVIFFSSNMPGGEGGYDLYYASYISDGSFGSPVNLGSQINTPYDEVTPYYSEGKLYYSTDGLPGFGGFDIFHSTWDGQVWSAPENMGRGYNSTADDISFFYSEQGYKGFIVSNRIGTTSSEGKTCCDDIFTFKKEKTKAFLLTNFVYRNKPLKGGVVEIYMVERGVETLYKTINHPDSIQYHIPLELDRTYKVVAHREDFTKDSTTFNTIGLMKTTTITRNFTLKYVRKQTEVETVTTNQPIRLSNIYYDYNDDKILTEAESDLLELLELLEKYSDMVIELSSHTDARGNDEYNLALSQRRANSAKEWLVERGIAESRIVPKGYGEQQILNKCLNDVECTEDEHRINRRTEFKIISGPTTIEVKKELIKGRKPTGNTPQRSNNPQRTSNPNRRSGQSVMAAPIIKWDIDFIDLGDVKKGDKKEFEFTFTNSGTEALEIKMITACECTTLDWPRKKIMPGEKGVIKGVFDSTEKNEGKDSIYLEVLSNTTPPITEARYEVNVIE